MTLEHYRLVEKIGEGGMGVVWKALDTTLGRDVAVKFLPDLLAAEPDRLARFEREARLLASLNHPNIAAIYGLHAAAGTRFLAMELVPGVDLARRLQEGGALPVDEALRIAAQVAEALETAHEQGVVHRDLKPANIKLTDDGRVKVLDFGLAKALEPDGTSGELSMSPTITQRATRAGVILGTAAYMSPEQARGRSVDRRADIWAFGVVLFELLTARRIFEGETVSDTLAAVLRADPDWSALPPATPPAMRRLLRRCLERDPRRRLRDIGDARVEIEDGLASGWRPGPDGATADGAITGVGSVNAAAVVAQRWRSRLLGTAALLAAVVAGAGGYLAARRAAPVPVPPPLRRFEIPVEGLEMTSTHPAAFSPDGSSLLYYAAGKLYVRRLSELKAREVGGAAGSTNPFWSPDGLQVGYFRDNKIWKVAIAGGEGQAITTLPGTAVGGTSGAWRTDGSIAFTIGAGPIYEIPAIGGDPRPLHANVEGKETDFHDLCLLPDGKSLVFVVHRIEGTDTLATLIDGKRHQVLQRPENRFAFPQYSPSGHLLFQRLGAGAGLWAAPFSAATGALTGEPFLVATDGGQPTIGGDGTLAYFAGGSALGHLVMVDRAGKVGRVIGQPQMGIQQPAVSPDGRRVAVAAFEGGNQDIWVHDIGRGTRTRLTFDIEPENNPSWTPSGDRLLYVRVGGSKQMLHELPADGGGKDTELTNGWGQSISPDGRYLAISRGAPGVADILVLPLAGSPSATVIVTPEPTVEKTLTGEAWPRVSPDGRYLAYISNESGRQEVYLRKFPEGTGRWQVSVSGGSRAAWNPRGGELFFTFDDDLFAVDVETTPTLKLGTPKRLFGVRALDIDDPRDLAVMPDGQHFVGIQRAEGALEPRITVVQSWAREFETAAPR